MNTEEQNTNEQPAPKTEPDVNELAQAIADRLKPPEEPEQQQPSPELLRMLQPYRPERRHLEALRSALADEERLEDGLNALSEISQGIYQQAANAAALMLEHVRRSHIMPLANTLQEMREQQVRESFFAQYPDLKPFEPLVEAVAEKLFSTGWKGTLQEGYKLVAEQTQNLIKQLPGNRDNGSAPSKMSALLGRGQAGAGDTKPRGIPAGMEIFES